ncbi:hypothetical protein [Persephonella sp.]|nr:hypothetical protein [Aquificota bacterium]
MERESVYVHYLIGDLESYVVDNREKVEKLINKKDITVEDSIYIFDRFSNSLKKTTALIKLSGEIEDRDTLRTISILSSETIAWVMFTLPSVEATMPLFMENLIFDNRHVIDALGELLLELDEFIENPERLSVLNEELYSMLNEVSMFFGHLSTMMKKGAKEN